MSYSLTEMFKASHIYVETLEPMPKAMLGPFPITGEDGSSKWTMRQSGDAGFIFSINVGGKLGHIEFWGATGLGHKCPIQVHLDPSVITVHVAINPDGRARWCHSREEAQSALEQGGHYAAVQIKAPSPELLRPVLPPT